MERWGEAVVTGGTEKSFKQNWLPAVWISGQPSLGLAWSSSGRDKFSVARLILLVMLMIGWDMLMSLMIGDNDVIMKTHTRWWLTHTQPDDWWWGCRHTREERASSVYWIIKSKLISGSWAGLAPNTVNTWLAAPTSHRAESESLSSSHISPVLTAVMGDIQAKYRWYPDHLNNIIPQPTLIWLQCTIKKCFWKINLQNIPSVWPVAKLGGTLVADVFGPKSKVDFKVQNTTKYLSCIFKTSPNTTY